MPYFLFVADRNLHMNIVASINCSSFEKGYLSVIEVWKLTKISGSTFITFNGLMIRPFLIQRQNLSLTKLISLLYYFTTVDKWLENGHSWWSSMFQFSDVQCVQVILSQMSRWSLCSLEWAAQLTWTCGAANWGPNAKKILHFLLCLKKENNLWCWSHR